MSIDKSDPRLTAYALGELDGDEREQFEAELADSPEPQRELEAIRSAVDLIETEMSGALSVDDVGFNVSSGVLGGYLTKDNIQALIEGLLTGCMEEGAPDFCGQVISIAGDDPVVVLETLVSLIGGFDSKIEGESVTACDGLADESCNALSVCLLVEMEATTIEGVSAE